MTRRHAIDWNPIDPAQSDAEVARLLGLLGAAPRSVLDLGCGDGRILRPLAQHGHRVLGFDRDPRAVDAARHGLKRLGIDCNRTGARARVEDRDFMDSWRGLRTRFDAILCVGRTLMTIASHDALSILFSRVAARLKPGGFFAVDDFPTELWTEVSSGRWREGLSRDGRTQLVWRSGQAMLAIRRGRNVNRSNWSGAPGDQWLRLWSLDDLEYHAARSSLTPARGIETTPLLVWHRSEKRGA